MKLLCPDRLNQSIEEILLEQTSRRMDKYKTSHHVAHGLELSAVLVGKIMHYLAAPIESTSDSSIIMCWFFRVTAACREFGEQIYTNSENYKKRKK